jgi:hypothetical protein
MIESLKNMENSESYLLQHVKYTHKKNYKCRHAIARMCCS